VYQYLINIENNTFNENLAGSKGSAVFLKNINSARIKNCLFQENGPLLSELEANKSPYFRFLSKRSLIFPNSSLNYSNEFSYLLNS